MSVKPSEILHLDGHEVGITRPEKVLFPKDGITKGEVIQYYQSVSPWMLPQIAGRPLSLQRYPDGIDKPGFFQKAAPAYYPAWIRKVTVPKEGGTVRHVVCEDSATLIYLANQACITPHIWLSQADGLHSPDRMVFDLDPSTGNLDLVIEAAHSLQAILEKLELPAFVNATGSRGLHVVVPLIPKQDFDSVRAIARQIAGILVNRDPEAYTMEQYKDKRGGRVFIDINRNAYAQTTVAPYALRARDGAPVAVPLDWAEIRKKDFRPDGATLKTVVARLEKARLEKHPDPWKHFQRQAASLGDVHAKLDAMESRHAA